VKKRKIKLGSAKKKAQLQAQPFERTAFRVPDGMEVFKLKEAGRKRIEILPVLATEKNKYGLAGTHHFEATYFANRLGADNQTYVSPRTFNERCPVYDEYSRLRNDPNADEEVVRSLRAKQRQLFYVLDPDEPEKGVQLWDMSYWLFGKQLDQKMNLSDEDDDFDQFFDPYDGLTMKLGVVEDQFAGNKFFKVATIDFAKRKTEIDEELWEDLEPLENLLKVLSYNELKAIMNMEEPETESDEDVDDSEFESDESEEEVVASVVGTDDDDDDDWDDDDEDWD
jgi:hypothetical protein